MSTTPSSIADLVRQRAVLDGDAIAYTFLSDGLGAAASITWAQLNQRASELASLWHDRGVAGQPVLLALASGLKFVESLMACWCAGAIAVPVSLPRHTRVKHRLDRVVGDAGAKFIVGLEETRQLLTAGDGAFPSDLTWLDPREPGPSSIPGSASVNQPIALLQYTSGSTGSPRGVIVSHSNLMHNSALIAGACGHVPGQTIGGWLPLFHDMGLIGLLVQAAYSGARCVFMSPDRFLMRPWLWLQMISDYGVCSSPAPNFAYDLCVDKITPPQKHTLNLSSWRNALNGSEPVRAATLKRFADAFESCGFSRSAFFPCYGLAEATLLVTGPAPGAARRADIATGPIGCGQPMGDTRLAIVDPQRNCRVPTGEIGEIWVSGPSCAQGYWKDPTLTNVIFKARLAEAEHESESRDWLRTGDLGCLADGHLYITGRIRELIIIAGRNLFPVDVEQTAEAASAAVAPSGAAAFSIEVDGIERLILAVELRRELLKQPAAVPDAGPIRRQISAAVAAEHGVSPHDIVLLRSGALPRTTSGKLKRGALRDDYLNKALTPLVVSPDKSIDGDSNH